MTVTVKCLRTSKYAEDAQTTQYTASISGTRTTLDKFTATNVTAGAVTLAVYLVPFGGTADNSNLKKSKTLAAGECYTFPEVTGHTLNPGDFLSTIAGAATSINIQLSGRENT